MEPASSQLTAKDSSHLVPDCDYPDRASSSEVPERRYVASSPSALHDLMRQQQMARGDAEDVWTPQTTTKIPAEEAEQAGTYTSPTRLGTSSQNPQEHPH